MTVNTSNKRIEYSGNGSTTVFAYNFRILDETHLEVILVNSSGVETVQTLTTHYTVAGAGDAGGGEVTMVTAPASGESLVLRRKMPFTQDIDYVSGDPFPAETHERGIDERVMEAQELVEITDRALKAPKQDSAIGDMPAAAARTGKLLTFGTTGDPEATAYTSAQVQAAINVAANAGTNDTEFIFHQLGGSPYSLADYLNGFAFVSVKDPRFGAVGDGSTDDGTALFNAIQYGITNNKAIYLPSGTYRVNPNVLRFTEWAGGSFVMFGDGATSKIKLFDDSVTGNWQILMDLRPNVDMERIELRDFVLDMNARTVTTHPGGGAWEQAHCLRFAAETGTTTTHLKYDNLVWRDAIGDGVNNQGTGRITQWTINNCREEIRSYTRSSIQQSYMADHLNVIGFTGGSIESEPVADPSVVAQVNIVGCNIERLDGAGPSSTNGYLAEYFVTGSTITRSCDIGLCYFRVSDSTIKLASTGRINYPWKGSSISNSRILLPYDSDTTTLTGIQLYAASGEFGLKFADCEILADTDTASNITGVLLRTPLACPVADVDNWLWEFSNCKFDPRAQRTVTSFRGGTWKFHNCELAGHEYAVYVAASGTYGGKCYIDGADCTNVTGVFLGGAWSTVDQSTTIAQLFLSGDFYGTAAGNITTVSGTLSTSNMVYSRRNLMLDALPTAGFKGDKTVLAQVAVGEGCEYQATVNSITAPVYRLTRQAGVAMDTTANRPTPTSNDVGLLYFDTTLDADGHPIWWNGAAWVDAQGVTPP